MGVEAAEEHEVPEDHEALDVVAVGFCVELVDDAVDGGDAGGAVVEGFWDGCGVVEEVHVTDFAAFVAVDAVHEFAPADDLAEEAFEGV